MEKISRKMSIYAKLFREALKEIPHDKWKCDDCGSINTEWFVDMKELKSTGKIEYIAGICQTCNEKIEKKIKEDKQKAENIRKQKKIKLLLKESKIPPKISTCKFGNLKIRKGAELAFKTMKRLDKADRWIYLYGDNNVGKSLIIGAAINKLAQNLTSCYYLNERSFFQRIKNTYNNNSNESIYTIFESLKKADVIFWDDFAMYIYSDHDAGIAYDIFEHCDTYYKKLVLISNIDLKDNMKNEIQIVNDRIGQRNVARLKRNNLFYLQMKNKPFDNFS